MPQIELNAGTVLVGLSLLVILAELFSSLAKGRKSFREVTGAERREAEMAAIRQELAVLKDWKREVDTRLESGQSTFDKLSADTGKVLDVLDAMLMHFISGNDTEKLRAVKQDLDHYKNIR